MRNDRILRAAQALRQSPLSYVNRALLKAALAGDLGRIHALIMVGAELNHRDREGRTAIMLAALRRDREMMMTLMRAGASTSVRDNAGHPLEYYENPPKIIEGPTTDEVTSILASSSMRHRPMPPGQ